MLRRSIHYLCLVDLLLCFSITGCGGAGPLRIRKKSTILGPWCGPNKRVQFGDRVVGHVHDGPKLKTFLVDDEGQEYDPAKLAEQVWSYLERTGDAKKIKEAFAKEADYPRMTIVSIKPVVVILGTHQVDAAVRKKSQDDYASMKQIGASAERSHWLAFISSEHYPLSYKEGLQWFSPDLKQRPAKLAFSAEGVAEVPVPNGKLKLIRNGDECQTARE